MCTGAEIAVIAGVVLSTAATAYSASQAGNVPAPPTPPPPPAPPPPAAVPPPPALTAGDVGAARERVQTRRRRGVSSTILTSPLGIAGLPDATKLGT